MKKNGFVSTALIYTFFILFLVLMVFLLSSYSNTKFITDRYVSDIEEELFELSNADLNLYIYLWDKDEEDYKYVSYIPSGNFKENISYCKNKSQIIYENNEVEIVAKGKDYCYLFFDMSPGNISKPTILASDNIASGEWHSDSTKLSFSGSTVDNGVGEVVYYYGTSASSLTTIGSETDLIEADGIYEYYVQACNSLDLSICSEVEHYTLKIDKTPPGCAIVEHSYGSHVILEPFGIDEGEGTVYYSWYNNTNYGDKNNLDVYYSATFTIYVKDGLGNENHCSDPVTIYNGTCYQIKNKSNGWKKCLSTPDIINGQWEHGYEACDEFYGERKEKITCNSWEAAYCSVYKKYYWIYSITDQCYIPEFDLESCDAACNSPSGGGGGGGEACVIYKPVYVTEEHATRSAECNGTTKTTTNTCPAYYRWRKTCEAPSCYYNGKDYGSYSYELGRENC